MCTKCRKYFKKKKYLKTHEVPARIFMLQSTILLRTSELHFENNYKRTVDIELSERTKP